MSKPVFHDNPLNARIFSALTVSSGAGQGQCLEYESAETAIAVARSGDVEEHPNSATESNTDPNRRRLGKLEDNLIDTPLPNVLTQSHGGMQL